MSLRTTASALVVAALLTTMLSACGGSDEPSAQPSRSATSTVAVPSKATIAKAPTSVRITCTPNGTKVSSKVVATSPQGVKLATVNATKQPRLIGYRILPTGGGAPVLGTIQTSTSTKAALYELPPGRMDLRCGRTANADLDEDVSLFIADRDQNYEAVDVEAVLGCSPKTLTNERIFPARATRSEALTLMAGRLPTPGTYTFKDGPGYQGLGTTTHLVLRDGKGYGVATVTLLPENLSYRPAITATC